MTRVFLDTWVVVYLASPVLGYRGVMDAETIKTKLQTLPLPLVRAN